MNLLERGGTIKIVLAILAFRKRTSYTLPPVLQLPPARLLASLMREYLFAEIAHTLMESLASENAARFGAMDSASRNIDDKLELLQRDARIAWQEETTSDMLDVVTGAEAVNEG